ncbi:hypothetical protein QRX60_11985 [Amycolatopsis mongoliensis]|uniref:Uncharacterized protein n=1 Tax=Amycolatopsis mongoliensis TaxID=715475 RepID=A0A9Y2JUM2_9PSEU|nr:hypothetical protein [Amycolatopsis sp. 4-36]WIY04523.1 hypothetical protein QRX60_11985 [Amycolatopsis sp. 4-36]
MTDLERKLAETLREQAGKVTPNLDAAWADQVRRQHRPRRRRATVWLAPLAAVLVVLTSVLLATQVNDAQPPAPPANPGQELKLAKPEHQPFDQTMLTHGDMAILTEFAGQTDRWRVWAYTGVRSNATDRELFCVAAIPVGADLTSDAPQYGTKSPQCMALLPDGGKTVLAGYVGETGGPLPPGKAVYLLSSTMEQLRLYNAQGDLSQGKLVDRVASSYQVFLADVVPGSPPVRAEVS